MGKSKKRILHKTNSSLYMTRDKALAEVTDAFSQVICDNRRKHEAQNLITLFGLSAEELSEAGVGYEHLKSMETII